MKGYSVGQVCDLLELKPHILRYWEQEISLLSPRKDSQGRRFYQADDLHLLYKIRYYIYEERLTLGGAQRRLWRDLENPSSPPDVRGHFRQLRGELLRLYNLSAEKSLPPEK